MKRDIKLTIMAFTLGFALSFIIFTKDELVQPVTNSIEAQQCQDELATAQAQLDSILGSNMTIGRQ